MNLELKFPKRVFGNKRSVVLPSVTEVHKPLIPTLSINNEENIPVEGVFDSSLNRKTREFFKNKYLSSNYSPTNRVYEYNMYSPNSGKMIF